jgi:hypothetical protein
MATGKAGRKSEQVRNGIHPHLESTLMNVT